ncbi:MAG TPA: TfoX/Sxy family protein [Bacteroidales bacterium]|nr:TfoX/Sxy family protein [Bacteroidales bacterium]
MNDELTKMPNIGKTLADKLISVGITTPNDLIDTGSQDAMIKIKTIDPNACINMLFALEGAVQGIRWHDLDEDKKLELKQFFNQLKNIY